MRVLLVAPAGEGLRKMKKGMLAFSTLNFALTLPRLASLTPEDVEVSIHDDQLEDIDFDSEVDLVGITAETPHAPRGYEIGDEFRKRTTKVIMGGAHATLMPEEAKEHADSVVIGEAEEIWPQIIRDFKSNDLKPFYRAEVPPSLENLPPPRLDLLKGGRYLPLTPVEASRGCPFACSFCAVRYMYGRGIRHRPIKDVIRDIKAAPTKLIFFTDDNVVGDIPYAKELFKQMIPLKKWWIAQASTTMAMDTELMDLAAKSGCKGVFLGLESASQESLIEAKKFHNQVIDYSRLVAKFHQRGILVEGGIVVGFDNDNPSIFDRTLKMVIAIGLDIASFKILTPYPGTQFFKSLESAGRIRTRDWTLYDGEHVPYEPAKMSAEELQEGFDWLRRSFYSVSAIFRRWLKSTKAPLSSIAYYLVNWGFHLVENNN